MTENKCKGCGRFFSAENEAKLALADPFVVSALAQFPSSRVSDVEFPCPHCGKDNTLVPEVVAAAVAAMA